MSSSNGSGPDFGALLSADLEPERKHFSIQGHECWVDLRMMDAGDLNRYRSLSMKFVQGTDASVDMHTVQLFLVEKTLVDWQLWHKTKAKDSDKEVWELDLGESVLPRQRRQWIEDWKPTPEFWDWLMMKCLVINNLLEDQEKNSPASSRRSRKKPSAV